MNTDNVEFVLTTIAFGTLGMSILIYVGSWLLHTITTPDVPVALRISGNMPNPRIIRRRVEAKPGIVCSLPIHQKGRVDDIRI